jgi:glycosyltransferase involved in cell wall biosynthesis
MEAIDVETFVLSRKLRGPQTPGVVALYGRQQQRGTVARISSAVHYRLRPEAWRFRQNTNVITREARRLALESGVEVLEMEEAFGWCGPISESAGLATIVRLHGPWFCNGEDAGATDEPAFRRRVRMEGEGLRRCHVITAPSRYILERTREYYGLELAEAQVIPNPVDPVPDEERWRIDQARPERILFVGRFDRHKGGDLAIDAFWQLAQRRPELELVVAGLDAGVLTDDGRRTGIAAYIEAQVGNPGVRERIRWLGQQSREQVVALRREARVTIAPSRYETFGLAAQEALAAGCPVVAAEAGGLAEIIEHERNGLLCKVNSADSLAEQIERVLEDDSLAQRLGAEAAQHVERKFSPLVIAEMTLSVYRRACGATTGVGGTA